MRRGLFATLCAAVMVWSGAPPARAQSGYTVVDLGTLGGPSSRSQGLNKKGQVVGASTTSDGQERAFLWSAAAGMVDLGTLGTGFYTSASQINSAGQVTGVSEGVFSFNTTNHFGSPITVTVPARHAFLFTPGASDGAPSNPQMKDLGPVGQGYYSGYYGYVGFHSSGEAINDSGQVAVLGDTFVTNSAGVGFDFGSVVWHAGVRHPVGFPAGGYASVVAGINRWAHLAITYTHYDPNYPHNGGNYHGGYVLLAQDTNFDGMADTWLRDDNADGVNDLLVRVGLPAEGLTSVVDLNDQGQAVGDVNTPAGDSFAFLWKDSNANGLSDSGELQTINLAGFDGSWAEAINNHGQVVGGAWNDTGEHYFVYDAANGARNLSALMPAGVTLAGVHAINDNGEIAGRAVINGQQRAILLKPVSNAVPSPEPGETLTDVTVTPSSTIPLSLTFDAVTGAGTVTVTTSTTAPPLPEGFQVSGTFINIETTATFDGYVEISVPYNTSVFPYYADGATEEDRWPGGKPRLLHYNTTTARWENITTSVNPENGLVSGRTSSFSPFAVVKEVPVGYTVEALFDQEKVKKLGSTVPIAIRLLDAAGSNVSSPNIVVKALSWQFESSDATGLPEDPGNANPDYNFRYDADLQGYVYNFQTKVLPRAGTYRLVFLAGADPNTKSVQIKVR